MPLSAVDRAIALLAEVQHGTFSRRQALACGASGSLIDRRVRAGAWVSLAPGVYALSGSIPSFRRSLWAALHDAGHLALVSLEPAGHLLGLEGCPPNRFTLLVPHGQHQQNHIATVHQTRRMPTPVMVAGFPVTPIERTLCDLGSRWGPVKLGKVTDGALLRRDVLLGRLQAVFLDLAVPGAHHMSSMRTVLNERCDGFTPTDTELARALDAILVTIPGMAARREVQLPHRDGRPHRVDRLFDDPRLIVEGDGRLWHARLADLDRDRRRDRDALDLGYPTARYGYWELINDARTVRAQIMRLLGR